MFTTAEAKIKRIVPVRLGPDEDLLKGIAAACEKHGIKNGMLVGAIGSLKHARILNQVPVAVKDEKIIYGHPETPQEWGGLQGVLELCSTQGLIYHTEDGKPVPQLHCTFSNAAGTVIGGHMVEGTIVKLTLEISIAELDEVELLCKKDPETGKLVFTATQL